MVGETSHNLVRCFFLREKLKSYAKGLEHGISRVHVVGAGVMGGDIAAVAALSGFIVTLEDREPRLIAPAIGRANQLFERRIRNEGDRRAALDRLTPDPAGSGLASADLVIEAVPERVDIKAQVFARCEAAMRPDAILATNTSSLLLETLMAGLKRPERFCGVHFFNPVPQMPLVEMVEHGGLEAGVRGRVLSFVTALDKLPLPVKSRPGFLVNRVLTPYLMEAFLAYSEGIKPEVIDQAAVDFGMPMGPLELADTVGLDVALHVAESLTGFVSWWPTASLARRWARASINGRTGSRSSSARRARRTSISRTGSFCRSSTPRSNACRKKSSRMPMRSMPASCSAPASRRSAAVRSIMRKPAASATCCTRSGSCRRAMASGSGQASAGKR
jgi:3-hydroxyacyl-CoA dehydrogenase/enoyl-CoA hydratase/3-hydroxybutyryl-CoA epimerase